MAYYAKALAINPEERYPVIATTSQLLSTGVDAKTCELVVLDREDPPLRAGIVLDDLPGELGIPLESLRSGDRLLVNENVHETRIDVAIEDR
jgi:hypothetical protein